MGRFVFERGIFLLLIPGLVTLFSSYASRWSWIQAVDNFALDRYFLVRGAFPPVDVAEKLPYTRDIILVETSHPVPRRLLARVLRQLREAKVVALDLMFVDNEAGLQPIEKRQDWYSADISRWNQDDAILARAIRQNGNVVLGAWMEKYGVDSKPRRIAGGVVAPQMLYHFFWEHPRNELWKSARYQAHLSVEPENGVVRRVRLWQDIIPGADPTPSLGLAAAAAYLDIPISEGDGDKVGAPRYLRFGERRIPLDNDGRLLIDYVGGHESFGYVSNHTNYAEVLNFYDPEDFRGKIVILGESSLQSKDVVTTPFGSMAGMQVHANIIATLLNTAGPLLPWPFWKTATLILFSSFLLAALLLLRLPPGANLVFAVAEFGALVVLGAWLFIERRQVLSLGPLLLAIALTYNAVALYEYQRTRKMLSAIVGRDMFGRMLSRFAPLQLGGDVEDACAFFCDLRGFSKLAAVLPPTLMSHILNEYVNLVVQMVRAHGGRPVSFQGDGVFALFEENRTSGDFGSNAVHAALEFLERFELLRDKWNKEGVSHLEVGVGIACGPMMVGLVGTKDHMKPDAIGDPVNIAARLQGLSEETGHAILISKSVHDRIRTTIPTLYCGSYKVRGRDKPLEVFTVFTPPEKIKTSGEKWVDSLKNPYESLQKLTHRHLPEWTVQTPEEKEKGKTEFFP
jgi:class 3 adenylate cyclase